MDNQVSVIIPCGGHHSEFVLDAIESCSKAKPSPDGIIVIDDFADPGVRDEDGCMATPWGFREPPNDFKGKGNFIYRLDRYWGRSYARNFGVNKVDTPWIYFLDADDFLEPTAISDFRNIIENNEVDLVYADYDYVDEKGKRTQVHKHPFSRLPVRNARTGRPAQTLLGSYNCVNIGMFVRRERFLAIGGFDEDMSVGEYWDLFLRYVANPKIRVYKHSRPFFVARQNSSVLANAGELMDRATKKIQAMIRGGYYTEWISR